MKTTTFTVSTKKGEAQTLRWLVVQEIPYPDIEGHSGRFQWRNFGDLFGQYGNKASGIGSNYFCHLLADTAPEAIPDDYNRTIFAGYADYHDKTKVNGGTFKLRGRDLGEMSIRFEHNFSNPDYAVIKVNGFDSSSSGERQAITDLICPALRTFINDNKAELKAEAIAKIKARFAAELKEAREQLQELENKTAEAVY